jgi:hypothetical protein
LISEAHKAQSYCLKNGILIKPEPQADGSMRIVIHQRGKKPKTDPSRYTNGLWAKKIWEYYLFYYNKRDKNVVSN